MTDKKVFNNKNGNMEVFDFIKLIHKNELMDWLRDFSTINKPCPPYELLESNTDCFRCIQCFDYCESQIKKNKDHYLYKKKKYYFIDLEQE